MSDLLLFESEEAAGVSLEDVQEVSNYVAALNHGLDRLRSGFPLSLRLMREIHAVLLAKGRGSDKDPGEFRRSQNWIGGSRPGNAVFVPLPPESVMECIGELELFIHEERGDLPLLIRAGPGRRCSLFEADRRKIEAARAAGSVLRVYQFAQTTPILSIAQAAEKIEVSFPTASAEVEQLEKLGVLREVTQRQRGRLFTYGAYLDILSEGTEPIRER